ncbi:hypothetical protein ACQEVB_13600 [Pseudonocardia sp. CA-107938]|uniref:hypothetical protein n=1 Tax=Pseudonocardia sp. CA-107938 TaxID=3240021 RepID=UPI003D8C97C2
MRLSRRSIIGTAIFGLVVATAVVLATALVAGFGKPRFTASSVVIIEPTHELSAKDFSRKIYNSASGGKVAAEVLRQRRWAGAAAAAIGLPARDLRVSADVRPETNVVIGLSAETTSPDGAERALAAIVADAAPTVAEAAGPFRLSVVQGPAGTAVPSGNPGSQLLIVIFLGTLLVVCGIAIPILGAPSAPLREDRDRQPHRSERR